MKLVLTRDIDIAIIREWISEGAKRSEQYTKCLNDKLKINLSKSEESNDMIGKEIPLLKYSKYIKKLFGILK